jgi:hypothetical protein
MGRTIRHADELDAGVGEKDVVLVVAESEIGAVNVAVNIVDSNHTHLHGLTDIRAFQSYLCQSAAQHHLGTRMVGQNERQLIKQGVPYEIGIARYREIARGKHF